MKPAFTHRIRRRASASKESNPFKKEAAQEHTFFSPAAHEPFFRAQTTVQRKCEKCEEEDKNIHRMEEKKEKELQRQPEKKEEEKLQRAEEKKEEEKVQKKEAGPANVAGGSINSYVNSLSGKGQPLPATVKDFFSSRMEADFSNVKIHTDKEAAASAKRLNAKAYTIGNDIVFNEGRYQPETEEGKKLLVHELVHVVQQDKERISKKDEESECNEKLDLEGRTDAVYNKGAGTTVGENKKSAKGCEDCEEDCIQVGGSLKVPYKVATTVTLPTVPDDLRPCQKQRVATAINTKLAPHEQQHVAAFKTFDGTPLLPINYKGCPGGYDSYLEGLAEAEFQRRKNIADAKSAKLDPFVVNVDLCCKDAPKKG